MSFVNIIKLLLLVPQSATLRHALLSYVIVICNAAVCEDSAKDRGPFVNPTHEGSIILLGADTSLFVITSWAVTKWLPGNTAVKNTLQGSWRAQVEGNNRNVWDMRHCTEQLFVFLISDCAAQPQLKQHNPTRLAVSMENLIQVRPDTEEYIPTLFLSVISAIGLMWWAIAGR